MRRQNPLVLTLQFLLLSLFARTSPAVEPARFKVTPPTVEMGTFYGGAKMRVAGMAGAGNKIIVVVRGPSAAEVFNKVGRVGPIWVNTGKVTISAAPSLLLIFSSEPVNTCLNPTAIDQYQLDLGSLKKHVQIETTGAGPRPHRRRLPGLQSPPGKLPDQLPQRPNGRADSRGASLQPGL